MGKIFNMDSPLMRFLTMMANLLWLNVLTILCCIPIFTIGASLTAMYYVSLKLVRGEEGYISSDFFRSFKRNFKQATLIWLVLLLIIALLVFDYWYVFFAGVVEVSLAFKVALGAATVFILTCVSMIYPVLAHFENTIRGTVKNAFLIGLLQFPKTILMILVMVVPGALLYLVPQVAPLSILFWFSFPSYIAALLYNKTFERFEPEKEKEASDYEWTVAEDEDGAEGNEVNEEESGESSSEETEP